MTDLIKKYKIETNLYEGDKGLLFDSLPEAEAWVRLVGKPFEIKEVYGVMVKKLVRVGLCSAKEAMEFQEVSKDVCGISFQNRTRLSQSS